MFGLGSNKQGNKNPIGLSNPFENIEDQEHHFEE
jgi:hypothetical protein